MVSSRASISVIILTLALASASAAPALAKAPGLSTPIASCFWQKMSAVERELRAQPTPNFRDDREFINYRKVMASNASVISEYDPKFKTRFYFNASGPADSTGRLSRVDPTKNGVYLFIHGSGTMKASGANFSARMDELHRSGYSAVSFDLPFHMDGPKAEAFYDPEYFLKWLKEIVDSHKIEGKPIYLVGHSFGPDVIRAFLKRYPHAVDGAVPVSPTALDGTLRKWYRDHTSKMKFGGDTMGNSAAGEWAARVFRGYLDDSPSNPATDPTLINPKLRMRFLTGDMEEYVPAPVGGSRGTPIGKNTYDLCKKLRQMYARIECTTEEGIGHYIFQHRDKDGTNVIMREAYLIDGKTANSPEILEYKKNYASLQRNPVDEVAQEYLRDVYFRAFIDKKQGGMAALQPMFRRRDEELARRVLDQYKAITERRMDAIRSHIASAREWAPEFYSANREEIDKLLKGGRHAREVDLDRLTARFFEMIDGLKGDARASAEARVTVTEDFLPASTRAPTTQ